MSTITNTEIERVFREEYGRAVAGTVRQCGDIDVAEEAVQDAFTLAVQRWPSTGLPPSPVAWIITTARNRSIDGFDARLRATIGMHRRPCCTRQMNPPRIVPCWTIGCA